jgi:hypothetical protein
MIFFGCRRQADRPTDRQTDRRIDKLKQKPGQFKLFSFSETKIMERLDTFDFDFGQLIKKIITSAKT